MIASKCTFEQMMTAAAGNFLLAEATSFVQVEYGMDDLKASWQGFVDTSDEHNMEFKSRKDICINFAHALSNYIEYLEESSPLSVGR
jgi:hypothetical protein